MSDQTRMKVLHLVSGDLWAGAEMQLFTQACTLNRRADLHVTVVLFNHGELERQLQDSGIEVVVLDETALSTYRLLRALIAVVRRIRPDIIHTHRVKENILGSLAGLFCGNPKSVRTTHGAAEYKAAWWQLPGALIDFLDWASGRYLQDRIISVSDELAVVLGNQFPKRKIDVVLNGIDATAMSQPDKHTPAFSDDGKDAIRVGLIGRLVPVKRVDLFIEIAQRVKQLSPDRDIRFHIIGDGPLREELEALSHQPGQASPVSFEGHRQDIHNCIRHLDILVMCSDHEGLPMVLLEAMALGTPIVAHAVGGISRLLDNGSCGVLVSTHTADAYAKEISDLADDPERRLHIRSLAAERVTTAYSAAGNADAVVNIYRRLLAQQTT